MNKKKWMTPIAVAVIAVSLSFSPLHGYAGIQDDLNREIDKIKQQEAAAEKKRQDAEKQKTDLKKQIDQETKTFNDLKKDIQEQGNKLNTLNLQLADVNLELRQTAQQLEEAEERVKSRDKLLKTRVRLMYMNGSVSYLDVLLSSTDFGDFLDRFHSLQTIVGKDKDILDANKKDRDVVVDSKKKVEEQLAQVKSLVSQAETAKQTLMKQEKQKEVAIASLSKQEQDAEDITEDQENYIVSLAKKRSELYRKLEESKKKSAANSSGTKKPATPAYSGGKLAWPVPSSSTISSPFGYRIDPIAKKNKLHAGVDIAAPRGTAIVAAESGTVLIADWVRGYGNTVVIDHGNGVWTWYGHIREGGIMVKEGDTVKRGEKIAEVGSTGDSTGNHCHFEVRVNENPVDPMPYVK